MDSSAQEIEAILREDAQLAPGPAVLTPLGGGVSCEIFKVVQDSRVFVTKRALAKLRVAADWRADVGRNAVEYEFYKTMAGPLEGAVPRVFFHNPARGYFTMECLENGWQNWKDLLLKGCMSPADGTMAGALLGRLHAATWADQRLAKKFDTTENFRQLRTAPYLRAAADRCPEVAAQLLGEVLRLESCRLCLIHGDFSPKNLLIHGDRFMLLDAEVAWFGEPAFDVAFLLTHLLLKGLLHAPAPLSWQETAQSMWSTYGRVLGEHKNGGLEARCANLLAALLLARVAGKSPVEYLTPAKQEIVRTFAIAMLLDPARDLNQFFAAWRTRLLSIS